MIGQSISHYRILARIGQDSAGILYKAIDTETDKFITIRILPSQVSANSELRDRLARDSTAIRALRHPNIAQVYEWSRQDAIEFAVMDAPEGESMYDFLERERPHRRNLLRFAGTIASALGAAHRAGLVHGPLQPSAIFISPTSDIKIFDFGFGVLTPAPASDEARSTAFGAAAPYVSPEHAQGETPDIRSDIFSYGALLYHLTTGQPPFRGGDIGETWTALIQKEPKPIAQITSRSPRGMDKLIERCMRKDPRRRFQQIAQIEPILEKMTDFHRLHPDYQASFLSRSFGPIAAAGGIALIAAAIFLGVHWWRGRPTVETGIGSHLHQFTKDTGLDSDPAVSTDSSQIAYASDRFGGGHLDIWVQPTSGREAVRLTNDPADDREPAFSPDGTAIAFRSNRNKGGVYVVPSKGGEARLLASEGRRPRYSPDGKWIAYWVGPSALSPSLEGAYKVFVIPAGGGEAKQIAADFASCAFPVWSPDSKRLLFLGLPDSTRRDPDASDWWVAPIEGKGLSNTGACQLFHQTGVLGESDSAVPGDWRGNHVFYSIPRPDGSRIWRAEISSGSWSITHPPVKVTNGKGIEAMPSVSANGLVAFSVQNYNADIWGLPARTNEGKLTGEPKRWTRDPGIDVSPSLSADGAKLLFQSDRSGHYNMILTDVPSGKETPIFSNPNDQLWPIISPDGSRVAWSEMRLRRYEHLYRPVGGGPTQVLCSDCGPAVSGWSRDSRMALVDTFDSSQQGLVIGLAKPGEGKPVVILQNPAGDLRQARFSPDDRWIAFATRLLGGSTRLYIAPFHGPAPTPRTEWIALTDGSSSESSPQWSPDGKLVYYTSTRDGFRCVWAQRLDTEAKPSGAPFGVYHLHGARLTSAILPFNSMDLFIGRDQILLSLGELTGNIWTAKVSE